MLNEAPRFAAARVSDKICHAFAAGRLRRPEVQALLDVGGMGEAYRARDTRLNRIVVLKRLSPDKIASEERKRCFLTKPGQPQPSIIPTSLLSTMS